MRERVPPSVLIVAREERARALIAAMLEESGIVVTAAGFGEASAATARTAYDLAIIAEPSADNGEAAGLVAALCARCPTLELLWVGDTAIRDGAAGVEPRRRFVGCVRERLLHAGTRAAERAVADEAEWVIAMAQIGCLYSRREAARRSGAHQLAEDLRREIGRIAGLGRKPGHRSR